MLGLNDPWIAGGYLLCILSSILCIIYGLINWNRGEVEVKEEDKQWAQEEDKISEEL